MRNLARAAALLAAMGASACSSDPEHVVLDGSHAQRMESGGSMLGEACDGHDHSASTRLSGRSYLYVGARLTQIGSEGWEKPHSSIVGPASRGAAQQIARPVFSGQPGKASCSGLALRTRVTRENGDLFLDWRVEIGVPGGDPAEPWRVSGRSPIDEAQGTASALRSFHVAGTPMILRINATPGPVFAAERVARESLEAQARHPAPAFASPLPDERPGRTLEDVTNPGYR